jgi:hypothetical protein
LLEKPKLKARARNDVAPATVAEQARPSLQRFLLKVDGQTKGSFATADAAEIVGLRIKKAYPAVHVSIYDSVDGSKTKCVLTAT